MTTNKKTERVRIVIADDNKDVREKVVQFLEPHFEVAGTAVDGITALEMVLLLKPEVVILDISMPKMSGIDAAAELKRRGSEAKIVFLTVHEDPDFVRAALDAGAVGYVIKSQAATDLTTAVRAAKNGQLFISPNCAISDELDGDRTT